MRRSIKYRHSLLVLSVILILIAVPYLAYQILKGEPPFESLVTLVSGIALLLESQKDESTGGPKEPVPIYDPEQREQIRRDVLANVKSTDIVLLSNTLEDTRLALDLVELDPGHLPKSMEDQGLQEKAKKDPVRLLGEASISHIFGNSSRKMLILGEPGSGKSTVLRELCNSLADQAEASLSAPVPVVLELANWDEHHQDLSEWIASQMQSKYQLPNHVTHAWLETPQMCLLLDGLDNIESDDTRDKCVEAINDFLKYHYYPVAVTSRLGEYRALSSRLDVSRCYGVLPLGNDQVEAYLKHRGFEVVRESEKIWQNKDFQTLSKRPHFLKLIAGPLHKKLLEEPELSTADSPNLIRHLYNEYVGQQFKEQSISGADYGKKEALAWLRFLATKLQDRNDFFVEDLQPNWLTTARQGQLRQLTFVAGILVSLLFGILIGIVISVFSDTVPGIFMAINVTVWFGVLFVRLGLVSETIEPIEKLKPPWSGTLDPRENKSGILFGGCFGGAYGVLVGRSYGDLKGMLVGAAVGILIGSVVGIVVDSVEAGKSSQRKRPNQGIYQSGLNALKGGIFSGLFVAMGVALIGALVGGLFGGAEGAKIGAVFGGISGFIVGVFVALLYFGGMVIMRHYLLRFLLYREGDLPLNLVPFLLAMTRRRLLVRGGPQFRFIHDTFREYLVTPATQETEGLVTQ